MTGASSLLRTLLIYSLCVPLAVFLGYLMAAPTTYGTFAWLGLVLGVLSFTLFLRWHHAWLIVTWNLSAVLFFIPGRPEVWLVMTWISLLISVVHYIINRRRGFLHAPSVSRPLLFLAVTLYFVGNTLITRPGPSLAGLGLIATGVPVYFLWRRRH